MLKMKKSLILLETLSNRTVKKNKELEEQHGQEQLISDLVDCQEVLNREKISILSCFNYFLQSESG